MIGFPGKSQNSKKIHTKNKTQYNWFPGKSIDSKKFSVKFQQNQTTSKNHRGFLTFLGDKIHPGGHDTSGGQNNIKNEFTAPSNTQCANFQQNLTT